MPYRDKKKKREHDKQYGKQWRLEHLDYFKQWYQEHLEYMSKYMKQWYLDHPGHDKQWRKIHPEKMKIIDARHCNKRRNLDFISLNKDFEGAEAHHIDRVYVIYIPKELHRSIYHSVLKNRNMDEINAVAFNYINTGGI